MPAAAAFVTDLVCVVVFVVLGRRNHDEGTAASGVVRTAAPFAVALVVGWLAGWLVGLSVGGRAARRRRDASTSPRFGLWVWTCTLVVGMVLRRFVFDRGTAAAFVVVAIVFLAATLLGWRLVAARVASWGRRRAAD